jgi:two-component system response regulator AtoC
MQLKLLRVLQERKFEPVGSTQTIEVDVRVILASNQPLEEVARGEFRQDLYYRINVVKIELPPLRDRIGDIPVLAEHFLAEADAALRDQVERLPRRVAACCALSSRSAIGHHVRPPGDRRPGDRPPGDPP